MLIGVGVLCHISYSIVSYLFVSCSGLVTSVREERERELFFLLSFTCMHVIFCYEVFLLSLAWDMLRYLSLVVRKPVFGVSNQVRHKPGYIASEDG